MSQPVSQSEGSSPLPTGTMNTIDLLILSLCLACSALAWMWCWSRYA